MVAFHADILNCRLSHLSKHETARCFMSQLALSYSCLSCLVTYLYRLCYYNIEPVQIVTRVFILVLHSHVMYVSLFSSCTCTWLYTVRVTIRDALTGYIATTCHAVWHLASARWNESWKSTTKLMINFMTWPITFLRHTVMC